MDKRSLVVDLAALAVYLLVANPAITGIGFHEWLGLGVFIVFFVHVLVHMDWIIEVLRGLRPSWNRTGSLAFNLLMALVFMMVMVSGILISGAVLPTLGLYAKGYYFWNPLHAMSAKMLLALLLVHMVVHWKWFAVWFKKGRRGDRE